MKIAENILNQLGGNKFIAMTGSKNFIDGGNYLSMKLVPNKSKSKYLMITLDSNDTYTMEFFKVNSKTLQKTTISSITGVYNDQLQKIFTETTGLYTKL